MNPECVIDLIHDFIHELQTQETIIIASVYTIGLVDLIVFCKDDGVEIARQEVSSIGTQKSGTFKCQHDGDQWIISSLDKPLG